MYAGGAGGNRDGVSGLRPQHFAGWGDELRQDQRRGGGARRLEVLQRGGERALERRGERETREPGLEGLQAAPVVPGRDGPGGSSPSAARRISQSANKPSRFGPRAAAPTSTIKRPSAGVVAWITRRGAPPPPPRRRVRC